jgi:hypothetical protein
VSYDPLEEAFLRDEAARYGLEAMRLSAEAIPSMAVRHAIATGPRGDRPAHGIEWEEPPATAHMGYTDIDSAYFAAARQVADLTGDSLQNVLELSQVLAGGNSTQEKCEALIALSDAHSAIGNAPVAVTANDVLELSVSAPERKALAAKGEALGPAGDFPIPDRSHLVSAIARYKMGRHAGHPASAVREHILKNAKRLGVQVELGDDHHDLQDNERERPRAKRQAPRRQGHPSVDGSDSFHGGGGAGGFDTGGPSGQADGGGMAMSSVHILATEARAGGGYSAGDVLRLTAQRVADPGERARFLDAARLRDVMDTQGMTADESEVVRLASSYPRELGRDPGAARQPMRTPAEHRANAEAERIIEVHELGRKHGKAHPARPARVTTATRAHSPNAEDASTDHHALVQRYLRQVQAMNGNLSPDKPYGSSESYGPTPYRNPGPSGKPQA